MNIEELFENEKWAGYLIVVPRRDVNQSIDYLKTEVIEYVAGLEKRIAELEAQIPKVVTPKNGFCDCGTYCMHNCERRSYCPDCSSKLNWE